MSRTQQVLLLMMGYFLLSTQLGSSVAFPSESHSCTGSLADVEDCLENIMHPDLSPDSTQRQRLSNAEETNNFWLQRAKESIRERMASVPNTKIAKNIILFLGDGMGLTTLAAARNLIGGEEQHLSFEKFPAVGLSKTYAIDKIVADSACTATAYLCGVKGNYGTIGVNGNVARKDCKAMLDDTNHVSSIAKWALDAGKAAGLVTTTRVTHASPAGVYAHTANRDWENDEDLTQACGKDTGLEDIAQQLIHGQVGRKLKVILGGGKAEFVDGNLFAESGYRKDGRNLIAEFIEQSSGNVFVQTSSELELVRLNKTTRLLGLFHDSHMDFHLDAVASGAQNTQPTLEQMTRKAIEFMQSFNDDGYFLFIEGGKIDMGHHETSARLALDETVEFSKAIALARAMTSINDTLIVATADHSNTLSLAGYQPRGSDIFGVADGVAEDGKGYLALSYANGPSFKDYYNIDKHSRRNPNKVLKNTPHDAFPATAPLSMETHSGEDVPVYASGPWEHLFTGVYEQHTIPHMMAYATCIGDGLTACS